MNRSPIALSLLLFALSSLHASAQSHNEGLSATKTDTLTHAAAPQGEVAASADSLEAQIGALNEQLKPQGRELICEKGALLLIVEFTTENYDTHLWLSQEEPDAFRKNLAALYPPAAADLARTHRLKTVVKVTCGTENPLFAAF